MYIGESWKRNHSVLCLDFDRCFYLLAPGFEQPWKFGHSFGVSFFIFRSVGIFLYFSLSLFLVKARIVIIFPWKMSWAAIFFLRHNNLGLRSATALTAHYFKIIGWADKIQITLLILGRGALSTPQCPSIDSSKRGSSVLLPLVPPQFGNVTFSHHYFFSSKGYTSNAKQECLQPFFFVPITSGSTVLQHWQL